MTDSGRDTRLFLLSRTRAVVVVASVLLGAGGCDGRERGDSAHQREESGASSPLRTLDVETAAEFRAAFDAATDRPRVLAVLSPG